MDFSADARWLWTTDAESQRNLWLRFRRPFHCPEDLQRATIFITADSRYELYLNGAWLGHGPVRSFPWAYGYDRYDVTPCLRRGGENVLAARVVHWGDHTFQYILGRGGFLCELVLERAGDAVERIVSDGEWRVAPDAAFVRDTPRIATQLGFEEQYDARRAEQGWTNVGVALEAPDDWATPHTLGPVGVAPWIGLAPRTIPFLTRDEVTPIQVLAAEVARPRRGYRWAFDLRERVGKEGHGLRAEPLGQRGQAFVTEIIAPRPCTVSLFSAVEYGPIEASCRGRVVPMDTPLTQDASPAFHLDEGRNLFVLVGTDWPSLIFETEEDLHFDASRLCADAPEDAAWTYLGPLDERDEARARVLAATSPDALPPAPRYALSAADSQEDVHLLTSTSHFSLPRGGFCDASIDRPQPRRRLDDDAPLVENVELLLHRSAGYATLYPHRDGDTHLVVDFGRELVGYLVLEVDAPAGTVIDGNLFEGIDDSGVFWTERLRNSVRYTCREGYQTFRSHVRRGFRYVSLTVRAATRPVKLYNLRLLLNTYPVENQGHFACSDASLTKIWEVAAYTVRLCMEDTYVDCPAYEQVFWVGDARNSALVNGVAFGAYDLTDRCLRLVGQSLSRALDRVKPPRLRERPHLTTDHVVSGWFSEIPMWTFLWIWNVWEHYQATGDRAALAALYRDVRECLERCLGFLTERDLLDVPDVWNLVDWAAMDLTRDGEVTSSSALLAESLRRAALMAETLAWPAEAQGQESSADPVRYRAAANRVEAAINRYCWSESRGAYVDTVRDEVAYARYAARSVARGERPEEPEEFLARTRVSEPTNTLVLLCGCAPPERTERILPLVEAARTGNFVGSDPGRAQAWPVEEVVPVGSPWFLFFTLETLVRYGETEAAVEIVREQWGRMIEKGATTFWETFPGYIPGHWSRSLCHGWSAAPAYFLSTQVLGVEPGAAGYSHVRVAPHECGLSWAGGAVPTPRGPVHVHWSRDEERWDVEVHLPPGVTGELVIPVYPGEPRRVDGVDGTVERRRDMWHVLLPGGYARYHFPHH